MPKIINIYFMKLLCRMVKDGDRMVKICMPAFVKNVPKIINIYFMKLLCRMVKDGDRMVKICMPASTNLIFQN